MVVVAEGSASASSVSATKVSKNHNLKTKVEKSPIPERCAQPSYRVLEMTIKSEVIDRSQPMKESQKTQYRRQREVFIEYAKPETQGINLVLQKSKQVVPDDILSDLDPDEQWNKVNSLDEVMTQEGLTYEQMTEILKDVDARQAGSQNKRDATMAAHSDTNDEDDDMLPTEPPTEKPAETPTVTVEENANANLSPEVRKEVERAKENCVKLETLRLAEEKMREANKEHARLLEDLEKAQAATKDVPRPKEYTVSPEVAPLVHQPQRTTLKKVEEFGTSDYANTAPRAQLAPLTPQEIIQMREELDYTTKGTRTALRLCSESKSREKPKLMIFLPVGWSPQRLQNTMQKIVDSKWFDGTDYDGMSEKGTPIWVYLKSEGGHKLVGDTISAWNPQIRWALDSPEENSQQKQQARDVLNWFIDTEYKICENLSPDDSEYGRTPRHFSLQWPLKRLVKRLKDRRFEWDPQGDWWSVTQWIGDQQEVLMRCEYDHQQLKQVYKFSVAGLMSMRTTGEQIKDILDLSVNEMYLYDIVFMKDPIPLLIRKKLGEVKTEQDEEKPPPQKSLGNSPSKSTKDESGKDDDWDDSWDHSWKTQYQPPKPKGGKGWGKKGGKSNVPTNPLLAGKHGGAKSHGKSKSYGKAGKDGKAAGKSKYAGGKATTSLNSYKRGRGDE